MPRETNPRTVFERLFGDVGNTSAEVRRARAQQQRSVLDVVMDKVARLKAGLATYDQRKIDEYLEAAREIERRIEIVEQQADRELPEIAAPQGIPISYEEHATLMFDLMVLAYQTDMTRVVSFMVGARGERRNLPADRHFGAAPPAQPSPGRTREDREAGEDQRLPHAALHRLPAEAQGDGGRRRLAAGPPHDPLRVGESATRTGTTRTTCRSWWPAAARARSPADSTSSLRKTRR